jgi:NAD(P)H-dependent flavin oxidoreductase YrpB (nitropropane dioxygenase family)
MLPLTWHNLEEVRRIIRQTRQLTDRPFGVNLILHWPQHERLKVCLEEGIRVVSFFWGDPSPYIAAVHAAGYHKYLQERAKQKAKKAEQAVAV